MDVEPKPIPIDRWLTLGAAALGIALYLLPKTPVIVVVCVLAIIGLLIHPIWHFPGIERAFWRQIIAVVGLLIGALSKEILSDVRKRSDLMMEEGSEFELLVPVSKLADDSL
jgi:hypothetical protein